MGLHCNDATVVGKNKQIWCDHTGEPCMYMRFCEISRKYYQTDAAMRCKVRKRDGHK